MCCTGVSKEIQRGNPVIPGRWRGLMTASDALLSTFEWWQTGMTLATEQQVLWLPSPCLEAHICIVPYSLRQSHPGQFNSP